MEKTQIAIWATPEEIEKIEALKRHHARNTNADLLRFLINQEAEKILPLIISNEINAEQAASL